MDLNNVSRNITGRDIADNVGNATESALHKIIEGSPIGEIPFVGAASERFLKNKASAVSSNINNSIRRKGSDKGSQASGASGFGSMEPPKSPNGGSGASPRKYEMSKTGGSYYPIERLSVNPEPYTFTLNTGINAPVYSPLYQNSDLNGNVSMRMSVGTLGVPNDSSAIGSFVSTVVYQVFYNAIQRAVSFSVGTSLTSTNITAWMNSMIRALNAYFFLKSVLAYNNNPMNRNDAMNSLRSSITPDDLNYLYELERILLGIPMPPNLVNFIWWFNGNYLDGTLPGSCICKFVPFVGSTFSSTTGAFLTNIAWSTIFADLKSTNNVSILVSRANPQWIMGTLPMYSDLPVFDGNWLSVFANTAVSVIDSVNTSVLRAPIIASASLPWAYNSFTNELDGAAIALAQAYDQSASAWLPNMLVGGAVCTDSASSGRYTSRLFWDSGVWNSGNFGLDLDPLYTYNHSPITGGSSYVYTVPSSQCVLGVNTSAVTQAGLQLVEWLFSIDTIGYVKDERSYDSRYSNSIGVNPRYKRSRGR